MIAHPEIARYKDCPIASVGVSVAFHDIDAMDVVWHGNYVKYFEIARCALLQDIDYDYPQMKASGYAWPVVDIRSRFILPVVYGDQLEVVAIMKEWDIRMMIKYLVINKASKRLVTRGQTIQVPVEMTTKSMKLGCPEILEQSIKKWKAGN